jgi:soluble cytochrome b562
LIVSESRPPELRLFRQRRNPAHLPHHSGGSLDEQRYSMRMLAAVPPGRAGSRPSTMNHPLRFLSRIVAACSLLLVPLALSAADSDHEHGDDGEDTPLQQDMKQIGHTFRSLNRGLRDPDPAQKEDYLAALEKMEALAVAAKVEVPSYIASLPAEQQPTMLLSFRADLAAAIQTMLEIERAILADDWDTAKALREKLVNQRNAGHKKYDPEKDKD